MVFGSHDSDTTGLTSVEKRSMNRRKVFEIASSFFRDFPSFIEAIKSQDYMNWNDPSIQSFEDLTYAQVLRLYSMLEDVYDHGGSDDIEELPFPKVISKRDELLQLGIKLRENSAAQFLYIRNNSSIGEIKVELEGYTRQPFYVLGSNINKNRFRFHYTRFDGKTDRWIKISNNVTGDVLFEGNIEKTDTGHACLSIENCSLNGGSQGLSFTLKWVKVLRIDQLAPEVQVIEPDVRVAATDLRDDAADLRDAQLVAGGVQVAPRDLDAGLNPFASDAQIQAVGSDINFPVFRLSDDGFFRQLSERFAAFLASEDSCQALVAGVGATDDPIFRVAVINGNGSKRALLSLRLSQWLRFVHRNGISLPSHLTGLANAASNLSIDDTHTGLVDLGESLPKKKKKKIASIRLGSADFNVLEDLVNSQKSRHMALNPRKRPHGTDTANNGLFSHIQTDSVTKCQAAERRVWNDRSACCAQAHRAVTLEKVVRLRCCGRSSLLTRSVWQKNSSRLRTMGKISQITFSQINLKFL